MEHRFTGENPRGWVRKSEQYFEFFPIHDNYKVSYAFVHFDAHAECWFAASIKPLARLREKLDEELSETGTHVWYVVENGPFIPMKDGPKGTKVPKGILEMDAHEAQLFSMDDKAKNIISCGLDMNEYNRVSACETTKEMWRLLEVTHEGTNQEAKLTAIQEANDLNVLKLEELVGSLMTHEIKMKIHDEEETTSKKKNLALKAEAFREPAKSSDDIDLEMGLITRKFKKFLTSRRDGKIRRSQTTQSHQSNNGDRNARENSDTCYECDRTGHIKKYCPQLKNKSASSSDRDIKEKKFKPRKVLLTWDDSDESDKETCEDDDVAQLCFMAKDDHSDEVITAKNVNYNKLELAFLELSENHEKLKLKNTAFKKKVLFLLNTVEELEGEKEELDEKVDFYIAKNGSLKDNLIAYKKENSYLGFEMSMMGELTFFLGLQIKQSKEGIFINQSKYTRDLLKRFGMDNTKPRGNPISPSVNLAKYENGKDVDQNLCRGMTGSLLYLTASRLDIMFSVCICACF
ncbi:hypothetical protein RJ640_009323 [Escallonia rubra]|uniref:CCHC-type domain-containing protein n=1 Tax=Escallonia rubra TaxID=112253 RepID=A0AA88RM52_9ASTE|nr:hypothetical protein RJ640_009323 [Escallonia rubra]